MLGLWPLGASALGADQSTPLKVTLSGVAATAATGGLPTNSARTLSGVSATGAIGYPGGASFTSAYGTASAAPLLPRLSVGALGIAAGAAAGTVSGETVNSVAAAAAVGAVTAANLPMPAVAIAVAAAGILTHTQSVTAPGIGATGIAGSMTPAVVAVTGIIPITQDGVFGLEPMGLMVLGANAPLKSWFSGIAGAGSAGPMVSIVNNSVFCTAAFGTVTPNPASNPAGAAAVGAAGALAVAIAVSVPAAAGTALAGSVISNVQSVLAGVVASAVTTLTAVSIKAAPASAAAIALAGSLSAAESVSIGTVAAAAVAAPVMSNVRPIQAGIAPSGAAGAVGYNSGVVYAGTFALAVSGTVTASSVPGINIVGCVASGTTGTLVYQVPSSSLGLWGASVAGGTVTLTFAGGSLSGSTSVAVTVIAGDTAPTVTTALALAVNGSTALQVAGMSARAAGNILSMSQPSPAKIYAQMLMTGT